MGLRSFPKLVILAGGLGKRLRPYTLFVPKPMLPLGDKPILSHIIEWANREGIRDIIIATAYLGKIIEDYFEDGKEFGVNITYAKSNRPLSSGGQLKIVQGMVDETFILSYSDIVTDLKIEPLLNFHREKNSRVTIVAREIEIPIRFGSLKIDTNYGLLEWEEKPVIKSLVNAGLFVMEPEVFNFIGENEVVSMDVVIRRMLNEHLPIFIYKTGANFIDVADQESYEKANQYYVSRMGEV